MSYYRIETTDLMPGEVAAPMLIANGDISVKDSYNFTYVPDLSTETRAMLAGGIELTQEEVGVIRNLLMSSVGILPLQGLSLMLTQHHYLSDPKTQSRKAYLAVEKQFWRSADVATWYEATLEAIQDALWHKACHPVNLTIKYRLAANEAVRDSLISAGAGSAAARLPAVETDVRTATSYITLFDTVRMLLEQFGGGIDSEVLELAIQTVKLYLPRVENPVVPKDRDPIYRLMSLTVGLQSIGLKRWRSAILRLLLGAMAFTARCLSKVWD